ncbi:MAG: helix-turn-helix transcriptional regulator [Bacteroidia bacterium]
MILENPKLLGNKIRTIRQIKGISQEAIAIKLLISQPAYSKIESGKIILTPDRFQIILEELGVTELAFRNFDLNTILI